MSWWPRAGISRRWQWPQVMVQENARAGIALPGSSAAPAALDHPEAPARILPPASRDVAGTLHSRMRLILASSQGPRLRSDRTRRGLAEE